MFNEGKPGGGLQVSFYRHKMRRHVNHAGFKPAIGVSRAGDDVLCELSRSRFSVCCVLELIETVLITDGINEAHLVAPQ